MKGNKLRQIASFALVGVSSTVIDFSVFGCLVAASVPAGLANVAGWASSFVSSYALNTHYTFRDQVTAASAARYLATSTVALACSTAVVMSLTATTGAWIAKLIATAVSFLVGFTLARLVAFRTARLTG